MSNVSRVTISALPLPSQPCTLTKNLTPDPLTPSPALFHNLRREKPSLQRRARLLDAEAHFSYVAPFPSAFPFRIVPPEGEEDTDKAALIEKWLSVKEALQERAEQQAGSVLKKYYPDETEIGDRPVKLIGLSETGLRDCLPRLDVGDAFALLGTPSLLPSAQEEVAETTQDNAARRELIEVLSGSVVLANEDVDPEKSWAPWSLRYSGHQFGVWAGQLGDGRAISLLATPHPSDPELTYELQLKGAGRTPFSRSADGLAVVRSSIREFLCAEAMQALGIATTRSLALIAHPSIPVVRERLESACLLTRVAPSFIRIGNFEALNPPESIFYLGGGGQQSANYDALRKLGEWVGRRVLRLPGIDWEKGDAWGKELVLEVARRNARMVAGWQAYGFMHGVINTDNVSILGLTIDYGPFAFMDIFDHHHVCNHSDAESRYAYDAQPSVILYALRALLNSLAPIIGVEAASGNKAVTSGWVDGVSAEQITEWRKEGTQLVLQELEDLFQKTCAEEYRRIMNKRLALRRVDSQDEGKLSRPLLDLMADHSLDFHSTFRRLAYFRPSMAQPAEGTETDSNPALDEYVKSLLTLTLEPQMVDAVSATAAWKSWLKAYAARIESEKGDWAGESDVDAARERAARAANPRFVLRQWVLEEVIKKVEEDMDNGKRILAKVLQMACYPFEAWGDEDDPSPEESLDPEIREERRYCGIGEKQMLGFQCSCSS
ncbi:hypothetical protein PHLGIDRAFT_120748 [Phlebiopsis gigantea 11061_1 CR5-6]|uniref:Selenoprotein O n=1 Tax=Phlebiopsis gigantea (strain 11061_1 CR5-6) TaxID=745531 RepID=A0A0C3S3G6_PHLG1|nr:hypothetical protein PHLGIDRAFT_120748 [Phlebiopsis gigantea 11061_1 CR5-6]